MTYALWIHTRHLGFKQTQTGESRSRVRRRQHCAGLTQSAAASSRFPTSFPRFPPPSLPQSARRWRGSGGETLNDLVFPHSWGIHLLIHIFSHINRRCWCNLNFFSRSLLYFCVLVFLYVFVFVSFYVTVYLEMPTRCSNDLLKKIIIIIIKQLKVILVYHH